MFKRKIGNTLVYYVRVPLRSGGSVKRTTGTSDRGMARRMEAMVQELADQNKWWKLLDAVTGGDRRQFDVSAGKARRTDGELTLRELYAAYQDGRAGLERLTTQLEEVDLEPYVDRWRAWLPDHMRRNVRRGDGESLSVAAYVRQVRTLLPEGKAFPRSNMTPQTIGQWLSTLGADRKEGGRKRTGPTRRKYLYAMSSFCKYLASPEVGVLRHNPAREVEAPRAGEPRDKCLRTHAQVLQLLAKLPEPLRTLEALIHATGMEISAALRLRKSGINRAEGTVDAEGTKTRTRRRTCVVSEWAWPYIERHVAQLKGSDDALLFEGVNHYRACGVHRRACDSLGGDFKGYRIHDARRTYAVRFVSAGAPMEIVSKQLGHASTEMVRQVYGRYKASPEDIRRWEAVAAAREAELTRPVRAKGAR